MNAAEKRERLRRFETLCRQRGLSLTVQRRLILETVLDRRDHPTADQLCDAVKGRLPNISRTTVYRVLETLVEIGAITKACSPGAATRFDPMTERHHHLVCLHCEKLIDVDDGEFRHRVELPTGRSHLFDIQDFTIQFYGICAACRKGRPRGGAGEGRTSRAARGGASPRKASRQPGRRRTRP